MSQQKTSLDNIFPHSCLNHLMVPWSYDIDFKTVLQGVPIVLYTNSNQWNSSVNRLNTKALAMFLNSKSLIKRYWNRRKVGVRTSCVVGRKPEVVCLQRNFTRSFPPEIQIGGWKKCKILIDEIADQDFELLVKTAPNGVLWYVITPTLSCLVRDKTIRSASISPHEGIGLDEQEGELHEEHRGPTW